MSQMKNTTIILAAACPEGTGSRTYEEWMHGKRSQEEVLACFRQEAFRLGPHKAYQVARILEKCRVFLRSTMADELVDRLLLKPVPETMKMSEFILMHAHGAKNIAILPYATACIPRFIGANND